MDGTSWKREPLGQPFHDFFHSPLMSRSWVFNGEYPTNKTSNWWHSAIGLLFDQQLQNTLQATCQIYTEPKLEIEGLLRAYLWHWRIEINLREEKTVLGCGQAQVRTPMAVEKVSAFIAAIYAMGKLTGHKKYNSSRPSACHIQMVSGKDKDQTHRANTLREIDIIN